MKNNIAWLCIIFLLLISVNYAEEINKVFVDDCSTQNMWKCVLKMGEISNYSGKQVVSRNRIRRSILKYGKCAIEHVWYLYRCWPCDELGCTASNQYIVDEVAADNNCNPKFPSKLKGYVYKAIIRGPTNLGTTVRASVHIKVPKLAADKAKLEEIASKYHLQVRGTRGEHTEAEGGVYDILNKRRMGLTKYDAVKEMYDGIAELIKIEKSL